jgi:hypothetical protein
MSFEIWNNRGEWVEGATFIWRWRVLFIHNQDLESCCWFTWTGVSSVWTLESSVCKTFKPLRQESPTLFSQKNIPYHSLQPTQKHSKPLYWEQDTEHACSKMRDWILSPESPTLRARVFGLTTPESPDWISTTIENLETFFKIIPSTPTRTLSIVRYTTKNLHTLSLSFHFWGVEHRDMLNI